MTARLTILVRSLAMALALTVGAVTFVPAPALAQDATQKEADEAATKRKQKAREQEKKSDEFNKEQLFRHRIGKDVMSLGPYTISLYVKGQLVEGKVNAAIQAVDQNARVTIQSAKWTVNGIVYPLAVRLFEDGRPTTEDLLIFKADVRAMLDQRFPDLVKDFFIVSLI